MKKFLGLFLIAVSFFLAGCATGLEKISKDLSTYNLNIVYDDFQQTLYVNEKIEYVNSSDYVLEKLCFHLYPNAFREGALQNVISLASYKAAYYNGDSFGSINIKSVSSEKNSLFFDIGGYDENILIINLENKLFPDDCVIIFIEFEVMLPNVNHRFGYGRNTVNLANFYPVACVYENGEFVTNPYSSNGDPFYSDMANYNVEITYPQNYTMASTGTQFETLKKSEKKTTKAKALVVRDFAIVLSEKFNMLESKYEDTNIYYYYYNDINPEKSLETSVLALKTFSELFGKYPYRTLSVTETNFVHGGMEYPNLVYIADNIINYEDYTKVIVHEIAHQWWYNVVGSNAYANPWQDEGLTDYSTALFYEFNPQYNVQIESIMQNAIKTYTFYTEAYSAVHKNLDTSMTRNLEQYINANEYVYIAYVKGMLLFDSLRQLIGDEKFFDGLRLYFKTYSYKNAQPYDMIWAFERATSSHLENFFNSWLEGRVIIMCNKLF